ncbi:39S ribosomal protein L28, mitochondrial [Scheffersomyces spartinae]|uniref:Large ribosomal subunit protein mL40 n=1 Tax=Scheffersomyces spartinae TaxID=45513 RepID=A0A9P8AK74_9ASCO|nr:39S ribosomal protein L28, mitochondrial [Scheffersomyces spartinae]KAG7196185.1 39S ribosomal protein L28, mitochondrial [Scheffersomyces spartinae]
MLSSSIKSAVLPVLRTFVRFKSKADVSPSTQRVIGQMSALSASKKQPKVIRLSNEDLIKHKSIVNAWNLYRRRKVSRQRDQLNKQYQSIVDAMEDLKQSEPELYVWANTKQTNKKFPLQLRVPTDYPPSQPWVYNVKK